MLPYRLQILAHIPETTTPRRYSHLLPEIEHNKGNHASGTESAKLWDQKSWRDKDSLELHITKQLDLSPIIVNRLRWLQQAVKETYKAENLVVQSKDIYAYSSNGVEEQHAKFSFSSQYPLISTDLTQWYIHKAKEIEAVSGRVLPFQERIYSNS